MNKKLLTIQVLKQRISNMQQDLNRLQKQVPQQYRSPLKYIPKSQDKSLSPIKNTSSNKLYKNPNFWTGNPILGVQNPYCRQKSSSLKNIAKRSNSFLIKSPIKQNIIKRVDLDFYQSAPQNTTPQKENNLGYQSVTIEKTLNLNTMSSKSKFQERYKNNKKIQKVKTYNFPKKDPILNPQPPKVVSKKITKPQTRSPANMYIENPNSNPNLYFHSTGPVTFSPNANRNKNKSFAVECLLTNSFQNYRSINQVQKTSSKKHYGRYFQDNFESKWSLY